MTDRELLELAAKAAGFNDIDRLDGCEQPDGSWIFYSDCEGRAWEAWNPLDDDGDALRLAVDLRLDVYPWISKEDPESSVMARNGHGVRAIEFASKNRGCRHAATRRAVVRAAAEIGRAMP